MIPSANEHPGVSYGNWEWRMSGDDITDELISAVKRLSGGRNGG
ncbi:MAG: hypothetical protein ACLR56_07685 [Oscillospiraceae bacterium]